MTRYFHGGIPGLKPGALVLPPDITGTDHRLSKYAEELVGGPSHASRTDVVYLTTDRNVARAHAAFYPDGALYQVAPARRGGSVPGLQDPGSVVAMPGRGGRRRHRRLRALPRPHTGAVAADVGAGWRVEPGEHSD